MYMFNSDILTNQSKLQPEFMLDNVYANCQLPSYVNIYQNMSKILKEKKLKMRKLKSVAY